MNMIGKTAPGLLVPPATPKSTTISRGQSRASSRCRGLLTAPSTPKPDHRDTGTSTPRLSGNDNNRKFFKTQF
jgi:hypothetical protein